MENGYLYVVSGNRWSVEAIYAINRLRELSDYPICVICDREYENLNFVANKLPKIQLKIIPELENVNFLSKVIGMMNTPFKNTLYMDTDTFIVENIDNKFSTSLYTNLDKYNNVLSEFNTGVILY